MMPRNNADFQQSALFHGSPHPFTVGDVIEPRNKHRFGIVAFATPGIHTAKAFAKQTRLAGPGSVFQVEPVDPSEPTVYNPEQMRNAPEGHKEVISEKGFKVVKEVGHWAPNNTTYHSSAKANCKSAMCKTT